MFGIDGLLSAVVSLATCQVVFGLIAEQCQAGRELIDCCTCVCMDPRTETRQTPVVLKISWICERHTCSSAYWRSLESCYQLHPALAHLLLEYLAGICKTVHRFSVHVRDQRVCSDRCLPPDTS